MLATARHETYYFPTGEYFSEQPEVGGVIYFTIRSSTCCNTKIKEKSNS